MTNCFYSMLQVSESDILKNLHSPVRQLEAVTFLKENYAFCVLDYDTSCRDEQLAMEVSLPSGHGRFWLRQELIDCGELLFQPGLLMNDSELCSLPAMIIKAIEASPVDKRAELLGCVCPAGGASMLPGLLERLDKELRYAFPSLSASIHINRDPQRGHAAWAGGAILSNLPAHEWQTQADLQWE
jgi:actin-related protein